ncbi:MAG TPA: C25 family cysteine peptidase [bacterium]|jgi:hypothetical protein
MISLRAFASPATPVRFEASHLPGQGVALDISRTSPAHTSISMRSPNVAVTTVAVNGANHQVFSIEGETYLPVEGAPAVPQISRFYRIPNTGGADLVISEADFDVLDNIDPVAYAVDPEASTHLVRDGALYTEDGWYPAHVATMSEPMIMRDFRVVTVAIYPVQVNPVTRQARIYRNISVDVVANDQPGINELTNPRRPSGAWASMYRTYISNLDETALDDVTTAPGTYMIFTNNNATYRPWADSLAEWKTRCGYKVSLQAQASWTATQVMNAIQSVYQSSSNPPLEYVALIGSWNAGVVPTGPYTRDYNSDHAYACLSGNDQLEDIGVGRLSGNSSVDMAQLNAKIMSYERNPRMVDGQGQADTLWFHKAFLAACTINSSATNYTLMQWAASQFRQNTGITNPEAYQLSGCPDVATCVNRIQQGTGIFAWRGTLEEDIGQAGQAVPNWRFPISMNITCDAATSSQALICPNSSTPTNPKGCVTAFGTMGIQTHYPQNITVAGGWLFNIASLGVEHIGDVCAGAKAQLYLSSQLDAAGFTEWNNLFGDPALSIWTDVPKVLSVTCPTALNVGARRVEVQVNRAGDDAPVADATVCLWKRGSDSTWAVGTTDATGHVVLPVAVNAPGTMSLTVTKRNHKPYLIDIPCNTVDCMPMSSSYTIDDDNSGGTHGNTDGAMNPGETIDLPIYVKNFGTVVTATGVSATLTSSNPRVTVVNGTASYADIAPGDSALGAQAFRIQVSQAMQDQETVQLTLTITSSSGQTAGVITLTCVSGHMLYLRQQFTDGTFGPGLTRSLSVTFKNMGLVSLTGVNGHLRSLSPFVTVNTADAVFGAVPAGALDSNLASPFVIAANPLTFRGHQAPMQLILSGDNGFTDTTQFTVAVGIKASTDPTGPDGYGYYAYDNTDTAYDIHPAFHYIDISGGLGTDLNLEDVGEKTSVSQIWSTWRLLPFPVTFYGRTYDTLTVCSNGWCAFGNQAYFDNPRNYPIPAQQAPDAMIAPYWDDLVTAGSNLGVWVYHQPDSGRYIIQWKATNTGAPASNLDFEVILYDSVSRPSFDGNNHIVLQYNAVTMNLGNNQDHEPNGCTVGIQGRSGQVGLPYAFITSYAPGAATIQNGSAILFTTDARVLFGQVDGHVYDAATNLPLAGAVVSTDRYGFHDTTDAQGHYHLTNVMIGTYNIIASKHRFNLDTAFNVMVALDSTDTLDFHVRHPEMVLSVTSLVDSAQDSTVQATFNIVNNGNGPVDYSSRVFFAGDNNPAPWDSVGSIDVTGLTTDRQAWGCELFNNEWWVSGPAAMDGQAMLYRFDLAGNPLGNIPQPCTTPLGWFDLATDGQYLYGSDSHVIYGIDAAGHVQDTIPSPFNPSRAIAYDPVTDHFWVSDYTTDIYEIDRAGGIRGQILNDGASALQISGLAWSANDPNGYKLYVFSRDPVQNPTRIRVTRFQPSAPYNRETVTDLSGLPGDVANGCTITPSWNSTLVVFAAMMHNPQSGSRMGIFEMSFNSSWITVSPATATVGGGQSQQITVTLNPAILRTDSYHVNAHFASAVYDSTLVLPITFNVHRTPTAISHREAGVPVEFALHQNFPNPFNPTTQISFSLPKATHVQLRIYNTLGQLVTTLLDETQQAGVHAVTWDAHGASTGVYLYQIRSGSFVQTRKMLLMK